MYNYTEIMRMARKRDLKLKESTLYKDFCIHKIKPEKFIMQRAYFSEEEVARYWVLKEASLSRVGRRGKDKKPRNK